MKIMDKLTGEAEYFEKIYEKIYGGDIKRVSVENKRENARKYRYVIILFIFIFTLNMIEMSMPDDNRFISKGGYVEAINRPDEGLVELALLVEVQGKENKFIKEVPIKISSESYKKDMEKRAEKRGNTEELNNTLDSRLSAAVRQINENKTELIILPKKLQGGEKLKWREENSNNTVYIVLLFFLCFTIIYKERFSKVKRIEKMAKESILRELPEFINKIVLLLNAGMVFSSAYSRVAGEGKHDDKEDYFLGQMLKIKEHVEETNSSLIVELENFSNRIQVRELIRTVNIIGDNIYKGSLLVEKLQTESELLWENRRKMAEEANRIGETKLSFPLAIHMIVLIAVTVAPALITT